jgi:hypothetical protein
MKPFNHDKPPEYMPVKYAYSADKLSDSELMDELVKRNQAVRVSVERKIDLGDLVSYHEERRADAMHWGARAIAAQLLENQVINIVEFRDYYDYPGVQTLRMHMLIVLNKDGKSI